MLWRPRLATPAIAVGARRLLVRPAIYSATVWQVPVNGTFPVAGPYIQDDTGRLGIPPDVVPIVPDAASLRARAPARAAAGIVLTAGLDDRGAR